MRILALALALLLSESAVSQTAPPLVVTQSHSFAIPGTEVLVIATQTGATACYWITGGTSATDPEVRKQVTTLAPKMGRTIVSKATPLRHGMVCEFGMNSYSSVLRVEIDDLMTRIDSTSCFPTPFGDGTAAYLKVYDQNTLNAGMCAVWFCPTTQYLSGYSWHGACATVKEIAAWPFSIPELVAMEDSKLKEVFKTTSMLRSLTDRERGVLEALRKVNAPTPVKYETAKNSTYTSRPVYTRNADGSRSSSARAGERVAVGAACDCTSKTTESNLYCSVGGRTNVADPTKVLPPDAVALCVREQAQP